MNPRHLALVGPTASGKTAAAVALARRLGDIELVSVDAMAVYRGLDIGTAKPTDEERKGVSWHLLDLVEPNEEFSVAEFQKACVNVRQQIEARGHRALYVGGTGLYHRAAIDGLDLAGRYPTIAKELSERSATPKGLAELYFELGTCDPVGQLRINPTNARRVVRALEVSLGSGRPFSSFGIGMTNYLPTKTTLVGLSIPRNVLALRIAHRLQAQLAAGFLEEVEALRGRIGGLSKTAGQALGYRELIDHLDGHCSLDEALQRIVSRTRRFAKRQEAWFRRDPRVLWIDGLDLELLGRIEALYETEATVSSP